MMANRPKHFLLVEDDTDHADLILECFALSSGSTTVERVAEGDSARAYLLRQSPYDDRALPDVVLLDLKLPGMDGHELLEWIKTNESLRVIPVVILTTSDAAIDRRRAFERYANSYLVKPDDFNELRELIEQVTRYWSQINHAADQSGSLSA